MMKVLCRTLCAAAVAIWMSNDAHAQEHDDEVNIAPQLEEVVPIPPVEFFVEEYDQLIEQMESESFSPQFFFGKKYRYCQIIPQAYRVVLCRDCVSKGIGGEAGRVYCGVKCGMSCSVRYGKCSEERNKPPCP